MPTTIDRNHLTPAYCASSPSGASCACQIRSTGAIFFGGHMKINAISGRSQDRSHRQGNRILRAACLVCMLVLGLDLSTTGLSAAGTSEQKSVSSTGQDEFTKWVYTRTAKYCAAVCENEKMDAVLSPRKYYAVCAFDFAMKDKTKTQRPGYQPNSATWKNKNCHSSGGQKAQQASTFFCLCVKKERW